jgi:hypothetical protein
MVVGASTGENGRAVAGGLVGNCQMGRQSGLPHPSLLACKHDYLGATLGLAQP